ncbi:hypothetical protein COHA_003405 [Chlorella ohadii]|uniref:Uncharacterized protein n=1 Tax=Chlorella ohadii TaxID=2649997 RepID=A0AAD5DUZ8_9CHLO|nr:hypothetical protein COHA_003405 [Chlorella ohadii]
MRRRPRRAAGGMALRPAACCITALLLVAAVNCAKPDGLGQFESHELDPGLDEIPGGHTLVAHIVPLHHSQDDVLVGAAAVAWQPEPGLEALHGDGTLLPAASEEDPGLLKGVSFGFEHPSTLPASLPNLSALETPAPAPAPAEAPSGNATPPAAATAGAAKQPAAGVHAPAATTAASAATTAAAAATHMAAASSAKPKPAATGTAAGGTAAEQMVEAAAVQPVAAKPVGAVAAKPVAAAQAAAAKPTPVPIPKPAAKPVAPAKALPTPQPVVAQQPPVTVPQGPPRMLISQGPDYALALPNPAVPQRASVPASVIFPGAVTAGARTTLGPFRMQALPPYPLQANRAVGYADLVPVVQFSNNHYYLHQIPPNPRAVVLMIHGCAGTAFNWWPQSASCNNCRGMPEQMSHTIQALARGYAVLAVSAGDMNTGCWSWNDDAEDVRDLVKAWLDKTKLKGLPLYGLGVSSGASFVLKLPRFFKFSGILSEALGIDPGPWSLNKIDGHFPPTLFVSMVKDPKQSAKIGTDWSILTEEGSPVGIIRAYERTIYPTYFSDRAPYNISQALSAKIRQGLLSIKMIDSFGKVLEEPRYTQRPWLAQLQEQVPELGGMTQWENGRVLPQWPESAVNMNAKAVWSLVNLAYANHEIISDYATVAFAWFESGAAVDLQPLLNAYTYGRPPWQRARKALEQHNADQAATVAEQQLGGVARCAAALACVAALAWLVVRRSRGDTGYAGLPTGAVHAAHATQHGQHGSAPGQALPSIIPGVRERFDLTEVVEQTGSPFSARRRVRTAFHPDAPMHVGSPTRNSSGS